jgi:hypothetical protein
MSNGINYIKYIYICMYIYVYIHTLIEPTLLFFGNILHFYSGPLLSSPAWRRFSQFSSVSPSNAKSKNVWIPKLTLPAWINAMVFSFSDTIVSKLTRPLVCTSDLRLPLRCKLRLHNLGFYLYVLTSLWRWNRQIVPKGWHLNYRRRWITQKKAYDNKLVVVFHVCFYECMNYNSKLFMY